MLRQVTRRYVVQRPRPPVVWLKEVERIGPREYRDPRSGEILEIVWSGVGPLPGQERGPSRRRDPLLDVIGV